MESMLHVAAFSSHPRPGSQQRSSTGRTLEHMKSLSAIPTMTSLSTDRPRVPSKYPSTSHLSAATPSSPIDFDEEMSTLPDPRSRARTPSESVPQPSPMHHPDLSEEVAMLSTKLINAINHQTVLDDTLSGTRHELESAKNQIKDLEKQNQGLRDMMTGDVWVRRSTLDHEKKVLQNEKKIALHKLEEEKSRRAETDKEKKKIEQELENLTAALFEEANKMVVMAKEEAREEHLTLQRKNDLLKAQLADSEGILKSQQNQLAELKHVMESMTSDRDDQTNVTTPSSPTLASLTDGKEDDFSSAEKPNRHSLVDIPPAAPLSFHHLLHPVLRTDLAAYDDFISLTRLSRQQRATSRVSSGSMNGFGSSLGLGGSTYSSHQQSGSTSSLNAAAAAASSAPQSPVSASSPSGMALLPSLKETRYYKRVLAEDVDPTLRLDTAPGLSWLARRTVVNAMSEGSLVVEPVPAGKVSAYITPPQQYPCSLCGESRKSASHLRNHRFRTSEADSAQRYPLCQYCLSRMRSACEFLGFLRMVKDGHYRADDEDHEKSAWEESVRLREQMFWARVGGGVVPVPTVDPVKSRRPSQAPAGSQEFPVPAMSGGGAPTAAPEPSATNLDMAEKTENAKPQEEEVDQDEFSDAMDVPSPPSTDEQISSRTDATPTSSDTAEVKAQ